ncbi:SPARC [Palaemon carinicauda]|uniref:SPARC n=1 Tax=Palaemon carinicauda TaxID=392227 RepID=UPI0035B5B4AE
MKTWMLVLLLVGTFCVSSTLAKSKSTKKAYTEDHKKHIANIEAKLEQLREMEEEIESEIALVEDEETAVILDQEEDDDYQAEEVESDEDDDEAGEEEEEDEREEPKGDPCNDMYCGAGRECVISDDGEGECLCQGVCEEEIDPRRKVCSNLNETWVSDCELYRQRCLCEDEEPTCKKEEYSHMHIDYYGECQEFKIQASEVDKLKLLKLHRFKLLKLHRIKILKLKTQTSEVLQNQTCEVPPIQNSEVEDSNF